MTRGGDAGRFAPFASREVLRGRFVTRPNRFLVVAELAGGRRVRAFLPNPGRLRELLLPGATLHLVRQDAAESRERKTAFTAVAVERDGAPVFLHTHLVNAAARHLLENGAVPGLEGARVVRGEAKMGRSRFDFLMEDAGREVYVEVKSVTLFGNGVAMFPDAVTERGRRHLEELAAMSRAGTRCAVVFLISTPRVDWFMPDYHTDLAFSRTFLEVRNDLELIPLAVDWDSALRLEGAARRIAIPWDYLEREVADSGAYLLLMRLPRARRLDVASLGSLCFEAGWYLYAGSAMRNLSQRVARHLRRRKRMHWHIDYLRRHATEVAALPIRSSRRQECEVAGALGAFMTPGPPGFGASDCECATHLFHARGDPLNSRGFHALLQYFRMKPPPESG